MSAASTGCFNVVLENQIDLVTEIAGALFAFHVYLFDFLILIAIMSNRASRPCCKKCPR